MTSNCTFKYALFSRNISGILKILAHSNICKMNKFFILLLLNIILPYTGFTQNPLLVKYNYETKILDKPFPFDQSFTVRITKIPDGWDSVTIKIREVKNLRKHVKKLSKDLPCITNEKIFGELKPKYKYTFNREQYCKGDSLEFTQLAYFAPNTDYVIDISREQRQGLSKAEEEGLIKYLDEKQIVKNLVKKLAEDAVNTSKQETLDYLTLYLLNLNDGFSRAINTYNCDYKFKDFTRAELINQLATITDFSTNLINLNDEIDEFYKAASKNDNVTKRDFVTDFKTIDLDNFEKLDAFYSQWKKDAEVAGLNISDYIKMDFFDNFKFSLKNVLEITQVISKNVVKQRVSFATTIGTTYFSGATENARTYLSFDAGYGANMTARDAFPYLGVNIYLRPIKREIPLKHYRGNLCDYFGSHFSLLVGMTTNSIESDPMRGGLIGNKAILLGGGFRVLPWLKLNYGRMVYYDMPANPLVNRRYLASDGFISASIDADVVEIFKIFFK